VLRLAGQEGKEETIAGMKETRLIRRQKSLVSVEERESGSTLQ
jgi:hypothetical protein